jgi:hypothetical protein
MGAGRELECAVASQLDAVAMDESGDTLRTYPAYAYPAQAQYVGSAELYDESTWTSTTPASLPDDHFAWLGDPGGQRDSDAVERTRADHAVDFHSAWLA